MIPSRNSNVFPAICININSLSSDPFFHVYGKKLVLSLTWSSHITQGPILNLPLLYMKTPQQHFSSYQIVKPMSTEQVLSCSQYLANDLQLMNICWINEWIPNLNILKFVLFALLLANINVNSLNFQLLKVCHFRNVLLTVTVLNVLLSCYCIFKQEVIWFVSSVEGGNLFNITYFLLLLSSSYLKATVRKKVF